MAFLKLLALSSASAGLPGPVWLCLVFSESCGDNDRKLSEMRLELSHEHQVSGSGDGLCDRCPSLLHRSSQERGDEKENAIPLVAGTRIYLRKRLAFLKKMPG